MTEQGSFRFNAGHTQSLLKEGYHVDDSDIKLLQGREAKEDVKARVFGMVKDVFLGSPGEGLMFDFDTGEIVYTLPYLTEEFQRRETMKVKDDEVLTTTQAQQSLLFAISQESRSYPSLETMRSTLATLDIDRLRASLPIIRTRIVKSIPAIIEKAQVLTKYLESSAFASAQQLREDIKQGNVQDEHEVTRAYGSYIGGLRAAKDGLMAQVGYLAELETSLQDVEPGFAIPDEVKNALSENVSGLKKFDSLLKI